MASIVDNEQVVILVKFFDETERLANKFVMDLIVTMSRVSILNA